MLSQSKHKSLSRLVQKTLPHPLHVVFRSKPFSSGFVDAKPDCGFGKAMAFLWHKGSHAVHPLTHLCGLATTALPSTKANTLFGQNSTQRGLPYGAQPSHFSGKIVGYHGVQALAIATTTRLTCRIESRRLRFQPKRL